MAILINKFSPIPLYLQLKNSIKENIANGTFKPGDKIPTEEEICNTYRISRTVTKQALSELVSEGYLVRYKSKGTFVNSNKNTGFFHEIISFNEEMAREGYVPRTKVISNRLVPCPEDIAEKLHLPPETPVICIERVRFRNDVSVYYVRAYYIAEYLRGLEKIDLTDASLYAIMESRYQIRICRTSRRFYPKLCCKKIADYLGIKAGVPIQYVESSEYDQYDRLISYDESTYVGDRNIFSVEITRAPGNK